MSGGTVSFVWLTVVYLTLGLILAPSSQAEPLTRLGLFTALNAPFTT